MKESELKGTAQLSHDMPMVVTTDNGEVRYCGKVIGVNQLYVMLSWMTWCFFFIFHSILLLTFASSWLGIRTGK